MTVARFPPLALFAFALPVAAGAQRTPAPSPPTPAMGVTSITVQQRMIIRVPRLPVGRAPVAAPQSLPPIRWVETKADRCVPVSDLAAAAVTGADSVDLLLNGGRRLRARFDDTCPALDFYSGFYVQMAKDGKVCARRDSIRSRSGGECRIESFRSLAPAR